MSENFLDLYELLDDYSIYKGDTFTGVVEREITNADCQVRRNVLGNPMRFQDGTPKIVLLVPLEISQVTSLVYAPVRGRYTWALYGQLCGVIKQAMAAVGVRSGAPPEAGAKITFAWGAAEAGPLEDDGITRFPKPAVYRDLSVTYAPPTDAVKAELAQLALLSPIERQFWDAYRSDHSVGRVPALEGLVFQYPVNAGGNSYRLDFALPERKIGIELDGFASHSSTRDIESDRRRQRALESAGWRLIRFGGREVHHDAVGCVRESARCVVAWQDAS